jgi:hypothetical protein
MATEITGYSVTAVEDSQAEVPGGDVANSYLVSYVTHPDEQTHQVNVLKNQPDELGAIKSAIEAEVGTIAAIYNLGT